MFGMCVCFRWERELGVGSTALVQWYCYCSGMDVRGSDWLR